MRVPFIRTAFAALLAVGFAFAASSAIAKDKDKDKGPTVSAALSKPLVAAQKAMQTNDFAGALVHIHEAQALPNHTPYDDYVINEFLANIAIGQKDFAAAATAYEALVDSPALPPEDKASTLGTALLLSHNVKHDGNALRYGEALLAMGPLDPKYAGPLAEIYFNQGNSDKALTIAKQVADTAVAAGKTPEEGVLDIIVQVQLKKHDTAAAIPALETLVQDYGEPGDWGTLIPLVQSSTKGMHEQDALNLYRLILATDAIVSSEVDYEVMANVAALLGYPGDEVAFLEHGLAKGTIAASDKAGAMLPGARAKEAEDKRTLPSFAAQAAARKTGDYDVKLAETYFGYGRYAEAEEAARRANTKGGTKDPLEAQLILGMALAREGKNAEAADVLSKIGGNTPNVTIAHLWLVYAQRKYGVAGATQ